MTLEHIGRGQVFPQAMKKLGVMMEKHEWEFCPKCLEKAKAEGRILTDGDKWYNLIHFRDGRKCCVNCANEIEVNPANITPKQTFANFKETDGNKKAIWKAREYTIGYGGLYLWGLTGRGKSHLLNAAYYCCREMGRDVKKVVWDELLRDVKATFSAGGVAEKDLFDSLVGPEYLLLDDIKFNVDNPEFSITTLYTILNGREIKGNSKIFITSNVSNSAWAKVDARIASRILGMCEADGIVHVEGDDWRGK